MLEYDDHVRPGEIPGLMPASERTRVKATPLHVAAAALGASVITAMFAGVVYLILSYSVSLGYR